MNGLPAPKSTMHLMRRLAFPGRPPAHRLTFLLQAQEQALRHLVKFCMFPSIARPFVY